MTDFTHQNLSGARFEDVNLTGADFHGVNLTGARFRLVDLTRVSFLDSAGVRLLDALAGDMSQSGTPFRLVVGDRGPARITLTLCAFRDDLLATDLDRAAAELGS